MLAVVAVASGFLLTSRISHASASNYWIVMLPVLLTGWAMIGFRMQIMLMKELRQARETVAKLAANEERLRLARDMHDLTGQSLSLITLKSELAAKRLARMPESAELDTVRNEITDIGRVSRQTLHDIREAVSGYRRPTLAIEIITARTSLEAAGINLDDDPALTMRSGTFDPDTEAALAWCLREAATNVIRHSGARQLPDPADGTFGRAVARGQRRRARAQRPLRLPAGRHRAARHVRTAVRRRRPVLGRLHRARRPRFPPGRHRSRRAQAQAGRARPRHGSGPGHGRADDGAAPIRSSGR